MIVNDVPGDDRAGIFTGVPTIVRRAVDSGAGWLVVPLVGEPYQPGDSISLDHIDALPPNEVETLVEILRGVDMDLIADAVRKDTVANLQVDPNPTPDSVWYLAAQAAVEALLLPIIRKSVMGNEGTITQRT